MSYACEHCGAEQTSEAGFHSHGMCSSCGSPMRIENLFSDRRIATLAVPVERREHDGKDEG